MTAPPRDRPRFRRSVRRSPLVRRPRRRSTGPWIRSRWRWWRRSARRRAAGSTSPRGSRAARARWRGCAWRRSANSSTSKRKPWFRAPTCSARPKRRGPASRLQRATIPKAGSAIPPTPRPRTRPTGAAMQARGGSTADGTAGGRASRCPRRTLTSARPAGQDRRETTNSATSLSASRSGEGAKRSSDPRAEAT